MSDRDTAGAGAYPPGSFGDAMRGFETSTGSSFEAGSAFGTHSALDEGTGEFGESTGQEQGQPEGAGSTMEKAQQVAGQAQEKAGQAVDTAKEKAGEIGDQATTKVDAGMDKAADGLTSLAGTLRERGQGMDGQGGTAGAMQSAATTAADTIEGAAQFLRDKDTDQLLADLEALVRRKPTESMLVAVGVGFLLSKALR